MTLYHLAILATVLSTVACAFGAPLLSLAYAPALLLVAARTTGIVDISSASHPLRFIVPIVSLSVAILSAYYASQALARARLWGHLERSRRELEAKRVLLASVVTFASSCTDIPALLAWTIPGDWVVVYLQIAACLLVMAVLLLPERWLSWKSL